VPVALLELEVHADALDAYVGVAGQHLLQGIGDSQLGRVGVVLERRVLCAQPFVWSS